MAAASPWVDSTAAVPAPPPTAAPIAAPFPPPAIAPTTVPVPATMPTFPTSFLVDDLAVTVCDEVATGTVAVGQRQRRHLDDEGRPALDAPALVGRHDDPGHRRPLGRDDPVTVDNRVRERGRDGFARLVRLRRDGRRRFHLDRRSSGEREFPRPRRRRRLGRCGRRAAAAGAAAGPPARSCCAAAPCAAGGCPPCASGCCAGCEQLTVRIPAVTTSANALAANGCCFMTLPIIDLRLAEPTVPPCAIQPLDPLARATSSVRPGPARGRPPQPRRLRGAEW